MRPTIVIGILTYRRPAQVVACVEAVARHVEGLGVTASTTILVVDNDPAGSARSGVVPLAVGPTVRYVVEPTPGIAAARNRALDESTGADLLVFIDDDELPTSSWLAPLLDTWSATRATAVMGRVVSEFDGELDDWVAAGRFFQRRSMPTGTSITVAAAGNLLLDRAAVGRLGVRFDETLGLGAGEDSLFSSAIVRAGGTIAWCEESAAIDHVPADRMTRRWVLDRARSHGNAETVVRLRLSDGLLVRLTAFLRGALRVLGGVLRYAAGIATRDLVHQARGLRTAARGLGIVAGALGATVQEYARPTGTPGSSTRTRTAAAGPPGPAVPVSIPEEHHHVHP